MRTLSCAEARRAVYIDFEGRQEGPPTLLGVLFREGSADVFRQYVLERLFWGAAADDYLRTMRARPPVVASTPPETLAWLCDVLERDDRPLVSWSTHELTAIENLEGSEPSLDVIRARFRDGKKTAKTWKARFHRHVKFDLVPRRGRHRLDEYRRLLGCEVPRIHAVGNTGNRIAYLRTALKRRDGDFSRLTPSQKTKWSNLVAHNRHDVYGMRKVVCHAACELEGGN